MARCIWNSSERNTKIFDKICLLLLFINSVFSEYGWLPINFSYHLKRKMLIGTMSELYGGYYIYFMSKFDTLLFTKWVQA